MHNTTKKGKTGTRTHTNKSKKKNHGTIKKYIYIHCSETVDCCESPLKNDNKSVLKSPRRGRVELLGVSGALPFLRYKRFHQGRFRFIAVFMAMSNDLGISFDETFTRIFFFSLVL